jgi:hypothetical protein
MKDEPVAECINVPTTHLNSWKAKYNRVCISTVVMHSKKRRTSFRLFKSPAHIDSLQRSRVHYSNVTRLGLATSSIPRLLFQWIEQILSEHEILLLGLPWL